MSRPLGVDLGVPIERWLPSLETADSLDGEGVDTLRTRLSRFHGNDERIDVDSLRLTTQLFLDVFDRLWR